MRPSPRPSRPRGGRPPQGRPRRSRRSRRRRPRRRGWGLRRAGLAGAALVALGGAALVVSPELRDSLRWLGGPRDYRFRTSAEYVAPLGGYRLEIEAAGVVLAGSDVSEASSGVVTLSPLAGGRIETLRLDFGAPGRVAYRLEDRAATAPWDWRTRDSTLTALLGAAGYAAPSPDEVGETARAIEGALAGPKGTLLDGQTAHLRVVRVEAQVPEGD